MSEHYLIKCLDKTELFTKTFRKSILFETTPKPIFYNANYCVVYVYFLPAVLIQLMCTAFLFINSKMITVVGTYHRFVRDGSCHVKVTPRLIIASNLGAR